MAPYSLYIQQTHFDGLTYTKGQVVDVGDEFGVVCKEFSEMIMPEAKPLATRDWPGNDGLEVYVPKVVRSREFELETEFGIAGDPSMDDEEATLDAQNRRKHFIKFLYGRNAGAVGARLAIYDEHSGLGYKDVTVKKVSPMESFRQSGGNEAIYIFKVTFTVHDPVTEVTPIFAGELINELVWE